ncbi:uncharacterized protein LOC115891910 [Sitophilus oryzae]|uniref:Uncharacterized protein LOC115891910 n=1 Tax=Sitophilus oryzae TaxID=7048 RepID=A0A6J2YZX4_SITOR|nr:uncharacterized protein LOC115891910 [Sitophilus oryzae]
MGVKNSKTVFLEVLESQRNVNSDCDVNFFDGSDCAILNSYDKELISIIKNDLDNDPEMFVLNNVLMCTVFHKNYKQDVYESLISIQRSQSEFLEPDVIMETVNNNITYQPIHGPNKNTSEPLVTKRLYVPMNKYVEIYDPMNHDALPSQKPGKFHVMIDKTKPNRKGFVKLKEMKNLNDIDIQTPKDEHSASSSSNSGSSDTDSSENNSTEDPCQLIKDQEEDYRFQDCLVYRKTKKEDIDIILDELDHENLSDTDVYDVVGYLNSRTFMKFFQSKIFKNFMAKHFGMIQNEIDDAYVLQQSPGKIFCSILDNNNNKSPVEVIPCLKIPWPERETFDFLNLDDSEMYSNPAILRKFKTFDCVLVPRGYSKKPGEYPEGDLEWEIHFPYAERLLECMLRPEQIKCYMVLLALHKEYIETFTKKRGVLPEHLLTVILHESERHYDGWPDHRLGTNLRNICKKFSLALQNRKLNDYFIRRKNLFKNASRKHLEVANEVFHNILQSPLMMILRALRNIRYTNENYYSPLDYEDLLKILYRRDWENLNIVGVPSDRKSFSSQDSVQKKPMFDDAEKQLIYVKHMKMKHIMEGKNEKKEKKVKKSSYSVMEVRRSSIDSIKDDWQCEKSFHRQKKIALLKFFIKNFMEIAKTSWKISTKKQTLFYVKQAYYLATILKEENELFREEVDQTFEELRKLEEQCITGIEECGVKFEESEEMIRESVSECVKCEVHCEDNADIYMDIQQQIKERNTNLISLSKIYSRAFSYNSKSMEEINEIR